MKTLLLPVFIYLTYLALGPAKTEVQRVFPYHARYVDPLTKAWHFLAALLPAVVLAALAVLVLHYVIIELARFLQVQHSRGKLRVRRKSVVIAWIVCALLILLFPHYIAKFGTHGVREAGWKCILITRRGGLWDYATMDVTLLVIMEGLAGAIAWAVLSLLKSGSLPGRTPTEPNVKPRQSADSPVPLPPQGD